MRRMFANPSRRSPASVMFALALSTCLLLGLAGCGGDDPEETNAPQRPVSERESTTVTTAPTTTTTAPTTTASTTTTTTAPPTTTTTAPPPPPPPPAGPEADGVLSSGESGDAVLALQQRLSELGYWVAEADGSYGLTTQQAVMAFQKAEGLGRDGVAGPETLGRLQNAGRVTAASTSGNLIEVDLGRQLLFVIQNGQVLWAFNTSTGTSSTPTPPGNFTISRQIDGLRQSDLGLLWRPKYFNGGIAVHGSDSIPGYPASHGCVRVSDPAINWMWASGVAEIGTAVWVH